MKVADLSPATLEKLSVYEFDSFIEKHEGPFRWASVFRYDEPECVEIHGHAVLLPIGADHHPNIRILRCMVGDEGQALTIFLKDTTFWDNPEETRWGGYVAFCERVPGEAFFLATFYHEWYILQNPPPAA